MSCPPGPVLGLVLPSWGFLGVQGFWDEMSEAQSKEPLTKQEGAGEWELTKKKKNYPPTFMALF